MSPWYTKIYDATGTGPGSVGLNWTAPTLQEPVPDVDWTGGFARYASRATTDQGAYFDLGTSPIAGLSAASVAFEYHVRGSSQPYAVLGDDNSTDTASSLEFFGYNSGNFWARSYIGGVQKTISGGTVSINTWYRAVVAYDGAIFSLYVNKALIASTAASGAIASPANSFRLGVRGVNGTSNTYPLFGGLRNVVFFNKGLTPSDVNELYREPYGIYVKPREPFFALPVGAAPVANTSRWFLAQ